MSWSEWKLEINAIEIDIASFFDETNQTMAKIMKV